MSNDELSLYLLSLEREDRYRVDRVLKQSESEITQRVFLQEAGGAESGPYIRKYIVRDSGLGGAYERIYQSLRAGQSFQHIPHVHEYYLRDKTAVVIMEHINGPTLADVVYDRDPSVQLASELFGGLCDAVTELHTGFTPPLIHRDLKPSNIIVRNGKPVIIDFGIARNYDETAATDTTHFGTRAYAPPEQFGYGQTDERSDVYALGMLLYFLLVEQTPTQQVIQSGFFDERIPEALRQVIAEATAFDPNKRFSSAAALKSAFSHALVRAGTTTRFPLGHTSERHEDITAANTAPLQPVIVVEQPVFINANVAQDGQGELQNPPPTDLFFHQTLPPPTPSAGRCATISLLAYGSGRCSHC